MRIIVTCFIILFCIGIDISTKIYVDSFAWMKHCYEGSPGIYDGDESRIVGFCFSDSYTGEEFYEIVYKDISTPILGEYLQVQLSYNDGIAFSLPIQGYPLQMITLLIILFLGYYYFREEYPKKSHLLDAGYALIFAGALSHAYERIFIGHVVDFISVKYFAILNFADIFISVGFFLIILDYVRNRRKYR